MITHGEMTGPITTLLTFTFYRPCTKVGIHALLCATSVCSVPLWFIIAQKKQPQRHRAHRGCTEKKPNTDFSCKASLGTAVRYLLRYCTGAPHCRHLWSDGLFRDSAHARDWYSDRTGRTVA